MYAVVVDGEINTEGLCPTSVAKLSCLATLLARPSPSACSQSLNLTAVPFKERPKFLILCRRSNTRFPQVLDRKSSKLVTELLQWFQKGWHSPLLDLEPLCALDFPRLWAWREDHEGMVSPTKSTAVRRPTHHRIARPRRHAL